MGLIIDTDVIIKAERAQRLPDFGQWSGYGDAYISVITASELLVGVHCANTPERRLKRLSFVEAVLATLPALDFDTETARLYAEIRASLCKSITLGAHDLMIAATALKMGFPVLTANLADFIRIPGVEWIGFNVDPE